MNDHVTRLQLKHQYKSKIATAEAKVKVLTELLKNPLGIDFRTTARELNNLHINIDGWTQCIHNIDNSRPTHGTPITSLKITQNR